MGRLPASVAARRRCIAPLLLAAVAAAGCAAQAERTKTEPDAAQPTPDVVAYDEYRDPLIGLNRGVFAANDVLLRYVLIPAAGAYRAVVPDPVEACVARFFENLREPLRAVNHALQLEPRRASRTLGRFVVNTTVGIGGLFDPATAWFELSRDPTTFGETLGRYGVGYGVYLVLPILGPSDIRSGIGTLVDGAMSPTPYLTDMPETAVIQGYDYFQGFAANADDYNRLRARTHDPYLFFRNHHLQQVQRDAEY